MNTLNTVTQSGMVASQPGISISTTTGCGIKGAILSVCRHYGNLKNAFGGKGLIAPCDGDGRQFDTDDQAWSFALDHGYIRTWYTLPEIRQARKTRGI
jgi:hypothetical protein